MENIGVAIGNGRAFRVSIANVVLSVLFIFVLGALFQKSYEGYTKIMPGFNPGKRYLHNELLIY